MAKIVCAKTLNYPKETSKGYDAVFADTATGIFALCDGANSSPQGGITAQAICQEFGARLSINREQNIPLLLQELHTTATYSTSSTGSTLVGLRVTARTIDYVSVGDSFLYIFKRKPVWGWSKAVQSHRDVDADGNPWQLIGSPIYKNPHLGTITRSADACAVLMSDGAGNFLSESEILSPLKLLKDSIPGPSDLQFFADDLARTAFDRGSRDDISILIIWLRI